MFGGFLQSMYELFKLIGEAFKQLFSLFTSEGKNFKNWAKVIKEDDNKEKIIYILISVLIFATGIVAIIML